MDLGTPPRVALPRNPGLKDRIPLGFPDQSHRREIVVERKSNFSQAPSGATSEYAAPAELDEHWTLKLQRCRAGTGSWQQPRRRVERAGHSLLNLIRFNVLVPAQTLRHQGDGRIETKKVNVLPPRSGKSVVATSLQPRR
jgi:hypothetical protein